MAHMDRISIGDIHGVHSIRLSESTLGSYDKKLVVSVNQQKKYFFQFGAVDCLIGWPGDAWIHGYFADT